jgi:endo-1,4-beta-xylanase
MMDTESTSKNRIRRRVGSLLIAGAAALLAVGAAALLAVGAIAMSGGAAHATTTITSNSTGTNNGYFYSFWEQDAGGATMTLGSGSNYQLTWNSSANDVVAGTGWATGSTAPVTYSGTWNCDGNCYLSLYGWTTNPLVEFYITDAYGDYNPSSGDTLLGTVNSDGGTYDLYEHQQVNQPCITGNSCTFEQYWAVRTSQRIGGTITVANIFNAWAAHGLNLGTPNYEILATEGYQSSGSSDITVSQGTTSTPSPTPTPTTSPSGGGGGNRNAYGQIAADSYNSASGVTTETGDGGTVVSLSSASSYIEFNGVQFGSPGASSVSIRADTPTYGLNLQVRLGSPTASPDCIVYPSGNNTWTLSSNSCYPDPSGTQNVYITTTGAVQINYLVFGQ